MTKEGPHSLRALLRAMEPEGGDAVVSVADVLDRIGQRSFAAAILVIGLIMVSPVSGIIGLPTISASIILLIVVQKALRRPYLWLPGWLLRRSIAAERMRKVVRVMRRPALWVDRHATGRLHLLANAPLSAIVYLVIAIVVLPWPFLELLPFSTTLGAIAVALLSVGLMLEDGVWVLIGYIYAGLIALAAATLLSGLFG